MASSSATSLGSLGAPIGGLAMPRRTIHQRLRCLRFRRPPAWVYLTGLRLCPPLNLQDYDVEPHWRYLDFGAEARPGSQPRNSSTARVPTRTPHRGYRRRELCFLLDGRVGVRSRLG